MRLFLGVELDDPVRRAAADAAVRLRNGLSRARTNLAARWVDPGDLHVTLWFIGEADDDRSTRIREALASPSVVPAFELAVKGLGAFPPSGTPRVLWLGVSRGADSMQRLYDELRQRLGAIGLQAESRLYSPHITIARVKEAGRGSARHLHDALDAEPADCGCCRVEAVTLFRSHLSPKGSRYEALLRVPLS